MPERRRTLVLVLAATCLSLAVGLAIKLPCASGDWADGRQYRLLCYTDIVPLYGLRGLADGDVPYLEADNEYPVLTGLTMWAAAGPARSTGTFFVWTAALLSAGALAAAWAVQATAGRRALFLALAPTLAIHAFTNWDLVAVGLSALGTLLFLRQRDGPAGIILGLGAAAKLYPALLVIPFALDRLRAGRRGAAVRLAAWTAGGWAAVNAPLALAAPERWSEFFRFSSERPADWDSMWLLAQHHLGFPSSTAVVNAAAAVTFAGLSFLVWRLVAYRQVLHGTAVYGGSVEKKGAAAGREVFRPWTFAFPLLVLFLVTNKVYSPQFSLWLLPWFALALPDVRAFALFSAAEVAVFVTRFTWFGDIEAQPFPSPAFQAALLARAAVLVGCVVLWVRRTRMVEA